MCRIVCVKFRKMEVRQELRKREAYSQTPEARLRQPEPRRDRYPALAPSQSNRFVNKRSHSLQAAPEMELLAQCTKVSGLES